VTAYKTTRQLTPAGFLLNALAACRNKPLPAAPCAFGLFAMLASLVLLLNEKGTRTRCGLFEYEYC